VEILNKFKKLLKREEKAAERGLVKAEEKVAEGAKEAVALLEYEESKLGAIAHNIVKKVLGGFIKKVWVDEVIGMENLPPQGGMLVASNHESYFDFLTFASVSPRKVHYMAAEVFFKSWLWRPLMHATGQIRVDRKNKDKRQAFQYVYSALRQERVIGIFPEGTRNRVNDGKLQKAFTGVARFALEAKVPVLPVGVKGTYEILAPHEKFPRFNKKAKVIVGEPMHFKEYHDVEHTDEILLEVTEKIMIRIAELSGKEYPHLREAAKK
jgi:1-acyl-sn-glycerol-3-phosphate acyltransferase